MRHAEKKNARGKSSCGAHTRGKQAAGSVATKLANARLPDWIRVKILPIKNLFSLFAPGAQLGLRWLRSTYGKFCSNVLHLFHQFLSFTTPPKNTSSTNLLSVPVWSHLVRMASTVSYELTRRSRPARSTALGAVMVMRAAAFYSSTGCGYQSTTA